MPAIEELAREQSGASPPAPRFPPVTRDHILHCSYDYWFPKYRTSCIKSRIIPLSPEFLEYLREDGIILADDDEQGDEEGEEEWEPTSSSNGLGASTQPDSEPDSDDEDSAPPRLPPNQRFSDIHQTIRDKIGELGGAVCPKLNWSAPKDAAWISPHQNTLKCTTPNDVYLLLKSSSFVSHDLEHAFDDCVSTPSPPSASAPPWLKFAPVLVLRTFFQLHPALEFRCFVKHRSLVAISARDLNHYPFLDSMRPAIIARARELFERRLRFSFPEGSFVFDVYIPDSDGDDDGDVEGRLGRARLIDINPWAPRTDSLLFEWQELLDLRVMRPVLGTVEDDEGAGPGPVETDDDETTTDEEDDFMPELRLVEKDDPAAYNFSSPQYSAHKLPKEVVDASLAGEGGLREFAERWSRVMEGHGATRDCELGDHED